MDFLLLPEWSVAEQSISVVGINIVEFSERCHRMHTHLAAVEAVDLFGARVRFRAYLQPTTHDAALLTASLFERDLVQLPSSLEHGKSARLRQAERVSAAEMRARPETRPAEKENVRHNRFPCSLPAQYLRLPDQTSLRNLEQDAVLNW